jgi:hypothetical protein
MRKKIKNDQIEKAVTATYNSRMDIQGNFIFGDFAETYETVNETLSWWMKNYRFAINVGPVEVYPGAQIYHRAMKDGIISDPLQFLEQRCPLVNLTQIPDHDIEFLFQAIIASRRAARIPATILKAEGVTWLGEPRISATVVCPHCGETHEYPNIPYDNSKVVCCGCRARWDFPLTRFVGRSISDSMATLVLEEGCNALKRNDLSQAVTLAQSVTESHPMDIDAFHLLGVAVLASGQSGAALSLLQQAVLLNPDLPALHTNLAAAYLAEGWSGFAFLHARQAMFMDPASSQAEHNMHKAFQLASRPDGLYQFMPAGTKIPVSQLQLIAPEATQGARVPLRNPLRQVNVVYEPA